MTVTYAVLMGDLVASESSSSVDQLHAEFNHAVREANTRFKTAIVSPLTITLGDEFQGLLNSLEAAGVVMRDLRLKLLSRSIDCRFALGTAELYTPVNSANAWNMMGPGLARTRERLNAKGEARYRFFLADRPDMEVLLEGLGAGLTAIERSWTRQQLDDIRNSLAGATPAEIASRRNVSVHSVYKVRSSGEYDAYLIQWDALTRGLKIVDEGLRIK